MPKISLAAPEIRQKYRKGLDKKNQSAFDALVETLEAPRADLDWYAKLGGLVNALRGTSGRAEYDRKWFKCLAEGTGLGASLLHKACRFRKEYPNDDDVTELKNLPTDWTGLTLAFPLEKAKRHEFLAEAARKKWNTNQIRVQVQERIKSKRQGAGGRKDGKTLPKRKPESAIRELKRLSEDWLQFQKQSWAAIKENEWKRFAQTWPGDDREKLTTLLSETERQLAEVAKTATAGQRTLAALLKKVKSPKTQEALA